MGHGHSSCSPTRFSQTGSSSLPGRRIVCGRTRDVGGHRSPPGCQSPKCPALVLRMAAGWARGVASHRARWAQVAGDAGATGRDRRSAAPGPTGAGVSDEPVDVAPSRAAHQVSDRGAVSPGACLASLGYAQLDRTAAGETSQGAERRSDPALDPYTLARCKKTLDGAAPGSSSKTRAASRSAPRSAARGRHGAKRPC